MGCCIHSINQSINQSSNASTHHLSISRPKNRLKINQKSTQIGSKIIQNRQKIDENSIWGVSWGLLGALGEDLGAILAPRGHLDPKTQFVWPPCPPRNRPKIYQKLIENRFKISSIFWMIFSLDFWWIFVDFWSILGAKIDTKIYQKRYKIINWFVVRFLIDLGWVWGTAN